jgi:hypothetical protein
MKPEFVKVGMKVKVVNLIQEDVILKTIKSDKKHRYLKLRKLGKQGIVKIIGSYYDKDAKQIPLYLIKYDPEDVQITPKFEVKIGQTAIHHFSELEFLDINMLDLIKQEKRSNLFKWLRSGKK